MIGRLERFPDVLAAVLSGLDPEEARYRPAERDWSVIEIAGHLVDEERDDFRTRLALTLEDPSREWPPIDPERRVAERDFRNASVEGLLSEFAACRRESVAFLRGLRRPDWSRAHVHARLGTLRAGDLLAAWTDHDLLHLRQITRRLHALAVRKAGTFSPGYAGDWPEDRR